MEAINILHISKKIPYPQRDGESVASYALATSLAEFPNISIDLLSLHTNKHTTDEVEAKKELSRYREAIFIDHNLTVNPLSFIQTTFSSQSYNINRFHSKALSTELKISLKKKHYNFVLLETIYTTTYIQVIREVSPLTGIILRLHNIEHLIWEQRAMKEANPIKKQVFQSLSKQLRQYKQNILPSLDKVITMSTTDQQWMIKSKLVNSENLHYLPVGFNTLKPFKAADRENTVLKIGFIGSMDWDPNVTGLDWFIKQVWGDHFSKLDTVRLHLAGRKYPMGLYESVGGVVEHGEVPDAGEFLDTIDVLIAPLFIGSGVRIKILEAMSRGKAIIASTVGIAGIDAIANRHAVIANNENEFVHAIQTLVDNRNQLVALQQNAFSFIEENYSHDQMVKSLVNLLNEMKA